MAGKKVVKFRKKFHPNLAFFLFILIIVYILVMAWSFFAKSHVSIYEVNTSHISDDAPLYGFIMREEEVIRSQAAGYVNYYCAEGSRTGKGDVIYTVDKSGEVSKYLEQLQKERDNSESIVQMREVISNFHRSFSLSAYNDVTRLKYEAKNVMFDMNNGSLYSDLKKAMASAGKDKDFTKVTAPESGVVAYTMDGYEDTAEKDITTELFDEYGNATRKQLQDSGSIEAGSPVYRLITSSDWSLVVKLDDSYYQALLNRQTVRVTVLKDKVSFNAGIELFDRGQDHFAKLTTSRFMEHYINDRFLSIEFNLKSASGLKIPNSSILKKKFTLIPKEVAAKGTEGIGVVRQSTDKSGESTHEFVPLKNALLIGENYYIDGSVIRKGDTLMNSSTGDGYVVSEEGNLEGVYYVNEGYCQFRPIEVQYKNKEYTIVSEHTANGLSAYDHIVVDPRNLKDDDFIE